MSWSGLENRPLCSRRIMRRWPYRTMRKLKIRMWFSVYIAGLITDDSQHSFLWFCCRTIQITWLLTNTGTTPHNTTPRNAIIAKTAQITFQIVCFAMSHYTDLTAQLQYCRSISCQFCSGKGETCTRTAPVLHCHDDNFKVNIRSLSLR